MLTKKRIIIALVVLIFLTLTAVFTEIAGTNYEEACLKCQSTRDAQEKHYFFYGASWTKKEIFNEKS